MKTTSLLFALFSLFATHAHAETILEILNPATNGSSIAVSPGEDFNAEIFVTGLPSANLDNFTITFDKLPTGISLTGFTDTDTLPPGWVSFSNIPQQQYGAANLAGSDIASSSELLLVNFSVAENAPLDSSTIGFAGPGLFQTLIDGNGNSINFSSTSLTLDSAPVPEPSTSFLLIAGLLVLAIARLRKSIANTPPRA